MAEFMMFLVFIGAPLFLFVFSIIFFVKGICGFVKICRGADRYRLINVAAYGSLIGLFVSKQFSTAMFVEPVGFQAEFGYYTWPYFAVFSAVFLVLGWVVAIRQGGLNKILVLDVMAYLSLYSFSIIYPTFIFSSRIYVAFLWPVPAVLSILFFAMKFFVSKRQNKKVP